MRLRMPGMVSLSRDIVSPDGLLLLARDYVLDERLIRQIRNFEESEGRTIEIYVRSEMLGQKAAA